MKKTTFILFLLFVSNLSYTQSIRDVFTNSSLTFFGVDCSQLRCIGPGEEWGEPKKLKDTYIPAWNQLFLSEQDKYNLKLFFMKDIVKYDLEKCAEINSKINEDSLVVVFGKVFPLQDRKIQKMIEKYSNPNSSGVGLVFIPEYFNKFKKTALIHVAFFDIATGNTLMIKAMEGEPGGFGLRNYWIKSIYVVMEKCEQNWKRWRKEAAVN